MRSSGASKQESQVIVDLRDSANGRSRIMSGGLLFYGNRRGEPFDRVDIWLLHEAEELARVGGQRLDVAALALGVNGVESQRGFAGAGEAGNDGKPIAGNRDVDVAEVMLSRPANDEGFFWHSIPSSLVAIRDTSHGLFGQSKVNQDLRRRETTEAW